jgi:sporulation protein YlmC with PRC-barrel domain
MNAVVDKTVATEDGSVIGTIRELVVDVDTWKVVDLQVRVEKDRAKQMGLKTPLLGSPLILIGTDRIQSTRDQVITDVAADDLADYVASRQAEE